MRLIGMLDSPYVRRVAISLRAMNVPFLHEPLSVFTTYNEFAAINPVVKAPTFVTDDGTVLMDSSLIIEYLERMVPAVRSLTPTGVKTYAQSQRIIALALAACEKTVQFVYERNLRLAEKQHQPRIERVQRQLAAAYRMLDTEVATARPWLFDSRPMQADITSAVAWRFTEDALPGLVTKDQHRSLAALSLRAEQTEEFRCFPSI